MKKFRLTMKHSLDGSIVFKYPKNFQEAMQWLYEAMKDCDKNAIYMRPEERGTLEGYFDLEDGDHVIFKLEEIIK